MTRFNAGALGIAGVVGMIFGGWVIEPGPAAAYTLCLGAIAAFIPACLLVWGKVK